MQFINLFHTTESALMDSFLAEILINNSISNAIKHSEKESKITILTNVSKLTISNFGEKALINPENLFVRFYKESNDLKSTGLGLAIVKKICDFYGFKLSYQHKEQKHFFPVTFK